MSSLPRLNFPSCTFRTTRRGDKLFIWDELRAQWLVLTPEEWVRRHLICWLSSLEGVDAGRLVQEYPVALGELDQRADVVVFSKGMRPLLLVECKAADVPIDGGVLAQAVRYNSVVGARYLMLTNGMAHYIYELKESGEYVYLREMPALGWL